MSSKKKILNQQKYLRRLNEIKKASARVDTRVMVKVSEKDKGKEAKNTQEISHISDSNKYQLPINEIKKDLKKNLIFAVFSIILVIGLKVSGFGFEQVKHLMNL
jgi:hypothetical protein